MESQEDWLSRADHNKTLEALRSSEEPTDEGMTFELRPETMDHILGFSDDVENLRTALSSQETWRVHHYFWTRARSGAFTQGDSDAWERWMQVYADIAV